MNNYFLLAGVIFAYCVKGVPRIWEKFIDKLRSGNSFLIEQRLQTSHLVLAVSGGDVDSVQDVKAFLGLDQTRLFWTGTQLIFQTASHR